jgi:hypothetical protein
LQRNDDGNPLKRCNRISDVLFSQDYLGQLPLLRFCCQAGIWSFLERIEKIRKTQMEGYTSEDIRDAITAAEVIEHVEVALEGKLEGREKDLVDYAKSMKSSLNQPSSA